MNFNASQIIDASAKRFDVKRGDLMVGMTKNCLFARRVAVLLIRQLTFLSWREMARVFLCDHQAVRRMCQRAEKDTQLIELAKQVQATLS